MQITPIELSQINPEVSQKRKKVQKIVEEFDQSMYDAYKISLDPGEYANMHSAYSCFHHAVVQLRREKSIQVRTSAAERCVYLIRIDITRGGIR